MTALVYTSGTAIATRMAQEGQSAFSAAGTAIYAAIGTAVNDIIEGYIGAPVGPAGTAARTYDGDGTQTLRIPQGINSITLLETASGTGVAFATVTSTNYFLRPHDHERRTGWPAFTIKLLSGFFPWGYDTVRVTPGVTDPLGWGWPAIPEELKQVAIVLGTRMVQARQSGETLVIGSTDFGQSVARFLPEPEYRALLDKYKRVVEAPMIR
jgi:hypothetical protein